MIYAETIDGSIIKSNGEVVFYSYERFIHEIVHEENCFLCGASPDSKEFNAEHVIPNWVLKTTNNHQKKINLPNNTSISYSKYTVPCCKECNSFLGKEFEEKICSVITNGYDAFLEKVQKDRSFMGEIFLWLALIFFKTHLKDSFLRLDQNKKAPDDKISSIYNWSDLHHIHALIRARQVGAAIDVNCLGSLYILSAKINEHYDSFDYRDFVSANTMLFRINDIAFVAVLNDSCFCQGILSDKFSKITGSLSPIQLSEILAHLSFINHELTPRPEYQTMFDSQKGNIQIVANVPQRAQLKSEPSCEFGDFFHACVWPILENQPTNDKDLTEENIKNGRYQFLFDSNGNFIKNSMELAV